MGMIDRRKFIAAIGVAGLDAWLPSALKAVPRQTDGKPTHASESASGRGIRFTPLALEIDGRESFLVSGEMHYFRVPRSAWRRRMELFKEAGGNCIATYVPWAVHEPKEGSFVFETGDGIHDLESFLQTAGSVGLLVLIRPGPYVGSELIHGGLPDWLIEGYPQILARRIDNSPLEDVASCLHPLYLKKVGRWYQQVCPMIAKHTVQKGGPVALMQLDNELTGAHIWRGSLDYSAEGMGIGKNAGRYPEFLRSRYGAIAALNSAYGTRFDTFAAVAPLAPDECRSLPELRRAKDYLEFYLSTIAAYTVKLADFARQGGVDVPFSHNAGEPNMSPLFLETVHTQGSTFLLGTDSYYNLGQDRPDNPTAPASVDIFCALEMLRIMGFPPVVFELQGGSPYNWPPIQAGDCAAWYWMHLAYGMKGANYYVFTGGPNPSELGQTSDDYDYSAAIGANGETRPLYEVQKEFGNFLKANEWLAQAEREADFRVALDFDIPRSLRYWKHNDAQMFSGPAAWDFLRKGLLTSSFCAGLSPELCDLGSDDWMSREPLPLVVPSSSCMSAARQQRIVRFLEKCGRVLIAPVLPAFDENFQPCTLLSDYLGSPALHNDERIAIRIKVAGVHNIVSNGAVFTTTKLPAGAEVLGVDERSGGVVAWQLNTRGGGSAILLGLSWSHGRIEQQQFVVELLMRLGIRPKVSCSNPAVWASLRTAGNRSILFLMNLFSQAAETDVSCRPGHRESTVQVGHIQLGPMSVRYIEV